VTRASTNDHAALTINHRGDTASACTTLAPRLALRITLGLLLACSANPQVAASHGPFIAVTSAAIPGNPLILVSPLSVDSAIKASRVFNRIVPTRYRRAVLRAALEYRLPPPLLGALIDQETAGTWDALIVGCSGDVGLAQASPTYQRYYSWRFDFHDPRNAEQSIQFAARYFRWLQDTYGLSDFDTIIAYKRGPNRRGEPTRKLMRAVERILKEAERY
jgi:soluble lytic murein transglycosylase-like protein